MIKDDRRAALKQESLQTLLCTNVSFLKKGKRQESKIDPWSELFRLHKRMKSNAHDEEAGKMRALFLKELK